MMEKVCILLGFFYQTDSRI